MDRINIDVNIKSQFKYIFDELCKGNISILTLENKNFLSQASLMFLDEKNWDSPDEDFKDYSNYKLIDDLKYLIMICNLLYNRTDMLVLPVEDGVYDLLLEKYKKFDPNFQVGSAVIQFKDKIEKQIIESGNKLTVNPLHFIESVEKDDVREYFESKIKSFDQKDKFNSKEIFTISPLKFNEYEYISKRSHNTKHNHPSLVGSLDKAKFVLDSDAIEKDVYDDDNVKILERDFFIKHIHDGIITEDQELEMVIELKYDGVSVEADCTDVVESARTRGDTGIGEASDITPILKGYRFHRNNVLYDREVGVKFEAIMTKSDLDEFNRVRGYNYANSRTAIIGLFGASDAYKFRDYITLIPLALDRNDVPEVKDRFTEIELLNSLYRTKGEPLRYCYIKGNYKTCLYLIKKFSEEAKFARNYLNFMFDGIVVSYLDEEIRNKLGRENFINKYSMAVKFDPLSKLTTFLGYTFEVGQTGNICPMIHYSPVEFFGTVHPKSSGASLNRFNNLALKPGDVIEVSYNNDVMPYVSKVDCEYNRTNPNPLCEFPKICPECGTEIIISSSGKSANCPNINCNGRKVARMVNMLQKLNIKGFAESTISQIGKYSLHELLFLSEEDINHIGPTNASNFVSAMNRLISNPIEDYRLIGSLGFTNIGSRKWKLILKEFTLSEFVDKMESNKDEVFNIINNIKNLGESTAKTILDEYEFYKEDIKILLQYANIVDSKYIISKKQIRFTGCRNKQLEEELSNKGYDINGGSVTKQTDILLVPYDGFSSTKISKVSENTMIIPINEFIESMDKYL